MHLKVRRSVPGGQRELEARGRCEDFESGVDGHWNGEGKKKKRRGWETAFRCAVKEAIGQGRDEKKIRSPEAPL